MEYSTTILIVAMLIYFLPMIAAVGKKGGRGPAILNIFLGWTLVG